MFDKNFNNYDNCHISFADSLINKKAKESYNKNELIVKVYEEELVAEITELKLDHIIAQLKLKCDIDFDKNELIRALNYDRNEYYKGFSAGYLSERWIDVNITLPEKNNPVLIFCGLDECIYKAYYNKKNECWISVETNRYFNFSTITHWQSLPNPPESFIRKEDDKNETLKV